MLLRIYDDAFCAATRVELIWPCLLLGTPRLSRALLSIRGRTFRIPGRALLSHDRGRQIRSVFGKQGAVRFCGLSKPPIPCHKSLSSTINNS